ncbi:MAG TPA: hypothetical protein VFF52_26875 [Isosphaeraceae bacterium]|nr:hypothetical protein [Isosphaeraceae bacterium]
MTVFARIARELSRRRPEVPLLVVEDRGTADAMARVPLDLSGLSNRHRMAHTPDPRDFYPVSRAVPTARAGAPWPAAIERLWDDPDRSSRRGIGSAPGRGPALARPTSG